MEELQERKINKINELTKIQKDINYLENEQEALRTKKKELSNILETQRTIQAKLVAKQDMLAKMECGKIDPEAEKQKFHQENQVILYLEIYNLLHMILSFIENVCVCYFSISQIKEELVHEKI